MKTLGKISLLYLYVLTYTMLTATAQVSSDCPEVKPNNFQVSFTTQLHDTKIFDYKIQSDSNLSIYRGIKKDTTPESIILSIFEKNFEAGSKILFNRKFEFERHAEKYCILKYDIVDKQNQIRTQTKQLVLYKNKWIIEKKDVNREIVYVIDVLSVRIFWKFYAKTDDAKYPEINILKAQTKDGDVLNIFKLYSVLKNNKTQLSKYMENESY